MEYNKKISQEYFNQIVSENINDFGMGEEEAIIDAINQLKSQGCELVNICKTSISEQDELLNAIKDLGIFTSSLQLFDQKDNKKNALDSLKILKKKFEKDISFRCLGNSSRPESGKNAYQVMIAFLQSDLALEDNLLLENFLSTLQAFLYQQSDAIEKNGLDNLV